MSRLLSAGFARLTKSRVMWIGLAFMAGIGILMVISTYRIMFGSGSLDFVFMSYLQFIGFLCAVFCSLFSGTEYSDGTIRNKLIAGHTRPAVYLSNLIVNITVNILFCLAYLLPTVLLGWLMLGGLETDSGTVVMVLSGSTLAVIAFTSLFTLISMINQNKSTGAALCMITAAVLFFASILIMQRLQEPEIYTISEYTEDDSDEIHVDFEPNPNYPKGVKREIYKFLYDFLPYGQMIQYTQMEVEHPVRLPLYSLVLILTSTTAGIFVFNKKNVK